MSFVIGTWLKYTSHEGIKSRMDAQNCWKLFGVMITAGIEDEDESEDEDEQMGLNAARSPARAIAHSPIAVHGR